MSQMSVRQLLKRRDWYPAGRETRKHSAQRLDLRFAIWLPLIHNSFLRGGAGMADDAYGGTIAKRRLARLLSEARENTGYTANNVCDILNWGRGKVGRFEANQWKRPEMSDIRDLIRIYEIGDVVKDEIEELAVKARARAWWRDVAEIFDSEFPGYENDATTIRVFMPLILPGLLQTVSYTEALLRAGPRPPAWRRKALGARKRRQEILDRSDGTAPMFSA